MPLQPRRRLGVEGAAGEQPLARRLRRVVAACAARAAVAPLLAQLHRGLEEVHVQPHRPVQLGQLPVGPLALEAVVADELPHDDAVLLLDEALVVLLGRPARA